MFEIPPIFHFTHSTWAADSVPEHTVNTK